MSKFADANEYNESMDEWGYALADLTPEQLARGIEQSIKTLIWPPEIAEFIALAKPKNDWKHSGKAYRQYRKKALPKPIDRELAKTALEGIRSIL